MKIDPVEPPRQFNVGHPGQEITLTHAVDLELAEDEQVTLRSSGGRELDVVRKSWGYYATPSLNGRLKSFGWRSALVESGGKRFLLLIEDDKLVEFEAYLKNHRMRAVAWLDGDEIELVAPEAGEGES